MMGGDAGGQRIEDVVRSTAEEERRHLEMMAATLAYTIEGRRPLALAIASAMGECIKAAQIVRDEQNRARTEGKAPE
jgi:Mn-containing catalase